MIIRKLLLSIKEDCKVVHSYSDIHVCYGTYAQIDTQTEFGDREFESSREKSEREKSEFRERSGTH